MSASVQAVVDRLSAGNPFRNHSVPEAPRPRVQQVAATRRASVPIQLNAVQRLISSMAYNHLPTTFFNLQKFRPLCRILATAKEILDEALPIRCLEACFLAIYLTQGIDTLDRIPLAFKSRSGKRSYRHIVLVVRHDNVFGALGLSRRADLMDKPLSFASLVDLVDDYSACFAENGHVLHSVKVGLPVSHNSFSRSVPCWRFAHLSLPPVPSSSPDVCAFLTSFSVSAAHLAQQYEEAGGTASDANVVAGKHKACDESVTPPSQSLPPWLDEVAEEDSDTEENQFRIASVLRGANPFRPRPTEGTLASPSSAPATHGVKLVGRVRGTVRSAAAIVNQPSSQRSTAKAQPATSAPSGVRGQSGPPRRIEPVSQFRV